MKTVNIDNQCIHCIINQKLSIKIVYGVTKIVKYIYKNINVVNFEIIIILHYYYVCYSYERFLLDKIRLLQHLNFFEFFFYIN